MRARAFAKINLSLRVLGTRSDGYHELRTIFQSIALHDTLTIRAARGPFRLICDHPDCPADSTNLIWRAADRVWRATGRRGAPRDVAVEVRKRIPIAAGLGGGSSDGAAALRALGRLWRVDDARLRAVARELGADVPFFFEGGTVLGLERGDLLFPLLDRPPSWVVLVLPPYGIRTNEAFAWLDAEGDEVVNRPSRTENIVDGFVNDLERPVAARHPDIRRFVTALRRSGASHAAMTGSGSTVFGLFTTERAAARAARAVAPADADTIVTRTLNRLTYQRLASV